MYGFWFYENWNEDAEQLNDVFIYKAILNVYQVYSRFIEIFFLHFVGPIGISNRKIFLEYNNCTYKE